MVGCLGWENAWVVTYERFIIKNLMVNLASQTSSLPWKIHRVHMFAQSSQALWWVDMSHWYFFESNILSSGCFMRIFNQRDYPDDNVKELVKSHLLYTKRPVRLGLYNTIIQASVSKVGVAKGLKQANFTRTELKDQVWWFFCNTYNWSSRFESSVGKFFQHLIFFGGGGRNTGQDLYQKQNPTHWVIPGSEGVGRWGDVGQGERNWIPCKEKLRWFEVYYFSVYRSCSTKPGLSINIMTHFRATTICTAVWLERYRLLRLQNGKRCCLRDLVLLCQGL